MLVCDMLYLKNNIDLKKKNNS